ncbi:MAG: hypothetical protein M5U19_11430, partial [Microthrixaceae bacterium]|nr:hypothetical protein [Microthrixaceae bacterium]
MLKPLDQLWRHRERHGHCHGHLVQAEGIDASSLFGFKARSLPPRTTMSVASRRPSRTAARIASAVTRPT